MNRIFLTSLVLLISVLHSSANFFNATQSVPTATYFSPTFSTEDGRIASRKDLPCNYAPGLSPGNRKKELKCCREIVKKYEFYWAGRNQPLSRYLETLKSWNCPQFETECNRKLFAFNAFTELMYDYFCNYTEFVEKCFANVSEAVYELQKDLLTSNSTQSSAYENLIKNGSTLSANQSLSLTISWKNVINHINPSQMTLDQLLNPCVQVAQYDLEIVHDGSFQEIVDFGLPSCGVAWCGLGKEAMEIHYISLWNCLSPGCRTRIVAIMVVCAILGLAIVVVNLLIILVISLNSHIQNSQSTFKLSLAAADLLVGFVVLPVAVDILRRLLWTRHLSNEYIDVEGYEIYNQSISENITTVQVAERAGKFRTKFSKSYENFGGFFAAVSIFVSVYTLAGAGWDRFSAVYNPLSYRKEIAHKAANRACIVSWLAAVIFGLLPLFTPHLSYALVLSVAFATLDFNGLIMYSVALFIPLVLVWVVNILTYTVTKKHSKFRRQLTRVAQRKRQIIERRLAHTLRLMVGVFTFNTLPLLLLLFCSFFLPTTTPMFPRRFKEDDGVVFLTVEFVAAMLLFGNSLWNFFIYNSRNRDFRLALKVWIKKSVREGGSSTCFGSAAVFCRSIASTSRKRLPSFQSFSRYSVAYRKKSSVATVSTKVSTTNAEESSFAFGRNRHHTSDRAARIQNDGMDMKCQTDQRKTNCEDLSQFSKNDLNTIGSDCVFHSSDCHSPTRLYVLINDDIKQI